MFLKRTIQLLLLVAGLNSVAFASKPKTLAAATAVQPAAIPMAQCQIKSHAEALTERRNIVAAIAEAVNEPGKKPWILPPLIEIVASYCATPQCWINKIKLSVPAGSTLMSVTECAPDKVAVSYRIDRERTVFIADVRTGEQNDMPQKVSHKSSFLDFMATGQEDVICSTGLPGYLALINVKTGIEHPVDNSAFTSAVTALPDGCCAIAFKGKVVLIKNWISGNELITQDMGVVPRSEKDKKEMHAILEIKALCTLPGDRLAVGNYRGFLSMLNCANGSWTEPIKVGDHIKSIVYLADDVVAVDSWKNTDAVGKGYGYISCWDLKNNRHLGDLFKEDAFDFIAAMPNSRIAVWLNKQEPSFDVLGIYSIDILKENNQPIGVKEKLEQEIPFESSAISHQSLQGHYSLYLPQASKPTMAIGIFFGAVQIWQEEVCPNCEPTGKTKTTQQEASCS